MKIQIYKFVSSRSCRDSMPLEDIIDSILYLACNYLNTDTFITTVTVTCPKYYSVGIKKGLIITCARLTQLFCFHTFSLS